MVTLLQEYFPVSHEQNRMWSEGDVVSARDRYYKSPLRNLQFLLRKRFAWMNTYIPTAAESVVEIGCGMGVSKDFILSRHLLMTDYAEHPWVEMKVDAMNMPFKDASVDVLIANNVIHHIAYPLRFFREVERVLKSGGRLLIQDIYGSLLMRFILRIMRHEGYSLLQNPFDESRPCNDPRDLWSANCALSNLLFDDTARFKRHFPGFTIEMQASSEILVFLLSGGVIAKSPTIELSYSVLNLVDKIDDLLLRCAPRLLALQKKVVLRKK
jgi:SAM-dependent methyltransferase